MGNDKRRAQRMLGSAVDAATVAGVLYVCCIHPELLNPWQMPWSHWLMAGIAIRGVVAFYDHFVIMLVEASGFALLPTRTTDKPVRYVSLDATSIVYLTVNSVHEWVFVQRLCHFLWTSEHVPRELSDVGLFNTLVALFVMFVVHDFVYGPYHHLLHLPSLYPLVHKHHHRQHFPTRGYLDAGNEHPIEHFGGIMCAWAAVLTAVHTVGAHAIALFAFFNIHAVLAMLNHSPYDVRFSVLGITYSVGNHEMHHRKFTVNYCQYCMWYDQAVRTYADYEGPHTFVKKVAGSNTASASAVDTDVDKAQ